MRGKVVITDFVTEGLGPEQEILGDVADVAALNASSEEQLLGRIEEAAAIMVYHTLQVSRRVIERLQRCRLIIRCGVGYDNVDHAYAAQRGIPVANIPDYGTEEVADSAIGLTLSLTRGISFLNARLRAGQGPWSYTQIAPLHRLRGRTFAIVGLGRIGTAAAMRAKALGMDVLFYDPYKPDGYDKALGVRRIERFEDLLAQAFVVSLHCPLTAETQHMMNRETLAQMPIGSYLINTARGGVVDVAALADALRSGHLAGAGVDVLDHEPPDPTNPLVAAWRNPQHPAHHRLILNPHVAFYCEEGFLEMRTKGAHACRRALLGQPIPNIVNGVQTTRDSNQGD